MKIRILSDLHMEGLRGRSLSKCDWANYDGEDLLILAGDIAVGVDSVAEVIQDFVNLGFPKIIYVMGNHEMYHHSYDELINFVPDLRARIVDIRHKVIVLDCHEIVYIEGIAFFGGTLWTDFNHDQMVKDCARVMINDFRIIEGFTPDKAMAINRRHRQFIKHAYEQTSGKRVIVTHFMPARECVHERWRKDTSTNLLNSYFSNDMGEWIESLSDTIWIYGHTHDPGDFMIGDTRMVCNPRGYTNELRPDNWNPNKIIEI